MLIALQKVFAPQFRSIFSSLSQKSFKLSSGSNSFRGLATMISNEPLTKSDRISEEKNVDETTNDRDEVCSSAKKQKVEDGTVDQKQTTEKADEAPIEAPVKFLKKRKYALLVGYSGEGYYGLQRNPSLKNGEFRTIEDEVVDALVKLNAIPKSHADEMYKMSFQRAARTDKGVSAVRNLLSLKMEFDENETLTKLNDLLPKQIRVFGYNKVTQSFDSKTNCEARTYVYLLPSFAFCPIDENLTEAYRCPEETIDKVNETLQLFVGTKNYHNFTSQRKYTDPSSRRYIMSFECSKPFLRDGYEFCMIKIKGQSFMLHQIRKMVGMVIALVRGFATPENLESCWTANKMDVPTAPALGLLLEKLHYDVYNRKFGQDGIHKPIEWPELEEEIEAFKHEYILSNIIKREISSKSMFKWLSQLPISHFGALNPSFKRGWYTGIGRALYLLENVNDSIKNDDDSDVGGDE